jgi:hypothetical protein
MPSWIIPSAIVLMILYWLYKPTLDAKATKKRKQFYEGQRLPRIPKRKVL